MNFKLLHVIIFSNSTHLKEVNMTSICVCACNECFYSMWRVKIFLCVPMRLDTHKIEGIRLGNLGGHKI
jgi:hypothetical protein